MVNWEKFLELLLTKSSDIITLSIIGLVVIIILWFIYNLTPTNSIFRCAFSIIVYGLVFVSIISAAFWLLGKRFVAAVS